jgi:hypothetical protein
MDFKWSKRLAFPVSADLLDHKITIPPRLDQSSLAGREPRIIERVVGLSGEAGARKTTACDSREVSRSAATDRFGEIDLCLGVVE